MLSNIAHKIKRTGEQLNGKGRTAEENTMVVVRAQRDGERKLIHLHSCQNNRLQLSLLMLVQNNYEHAYYVPLFKPQQSFDAVDVLIAKKLCR